MIGRILCGNTTELITNSGRTLGMMNLKTDATQKLERP